jgi:uncharacterized protein
MCATKSSLPEFAETSAGRVSVAWDGPRDSRATIILGHGAGANLHSDFMATFAAGLGEREWQVCRFNFAYMERGRKAPDKQPVLETTFTEVIEQIGSVDGGRPLVLGGKSLGGRVASHIVSSGTEAEALVFLGYPLHPPGRPDRIRSDHLGRINVPMLFVEGTRDPFCPLETLGATLAQLDVDATVVRIEGGDHSLKVRKSSQRTTEHAWEEAVEAIHAWLQKILL